MLPSRGSVIVAVGEKATQEALGARASLLSHGMTDSQVMTLSDGATGDDASLLPRSRVLKLGVLRAAPWDHVLYMDADCRISDDNFTRGFDVLGAGWDMAMTVSRQQGKEAFWHCGEADRKATLAEAPLTPQMQCGLMFIARNERTLALFDAWQDEWRRFGAEDQAAFIRALVHTPVRVWVLGEPWNGGSVIHHRWGACRVK